MPRLDYTEQGEPSDSAVVFLPGPTDSWLSYRQVLELLPPSLRAIAVSQRGHGDSEKPDAGYAVEDFAADAIEFMDERGVARAILVGHSGSCLVARRVAIDHPGRVAGLVLEASPTSLKGDPELAAFVDSGVSRLEDPIDPAFARSFVIETSAADLAPELIDQLAADLAKAPVRVWREMFDAILRYDDRDDLARIGAPTLLIWGDADQLVGREMQEELVRRIPNARLAAYAGVGHTPRWEDPARFARDVTSAAVTGGGP